MPVLEVRARRVGGSQLPSPAAEVRPERRTTLGLLLVGNNPPRLPLKVNHTKCKTVLQKKS